MYQRNAKTEAAAEGGSAMEAETIQKNGSNLKRRMSKFQFRFFTVLYIGLTLSAKLYGQEVNQSAGAVNNSSELLRFIAATHKLTAEDSKSLRPDTVIDIDRVDINGVAYISAKKMAEIQEATIIYDTDTITGSMGIRNAKTMIEMPVNSNDITINGFTARINSRFVYRGDTLYVPVREIASLLNSTIEMKEGTAKISRPFHSKILLVGTDNPNMDTYGAAMSVINTTYFSMFYYHTLEQAQGALEKFLKRDDVRYAEFDYIIPSPELNEELSFPCSDCGEEFNPLFPNPGLSELDGDSFGEVMASCTESQKNNNNPPKNAVRYQQYVNAYNSMSATYKSIKTVGVLDTGFTLTDDMFSGRLSSTPGYDVADNDNDITSAHWHGTHTAGVVAQFAPMANVKILPIKVFRGDGNSGCYASDVANGINYAVDHGADVINMSLGGFGAGGTYQTAINNAYNAGVIVVASAGNEGINARSLAPARLDHVVTVGGTDSIGSNILWTGTTNSNYGEIVDIWAPGRFITSAYVDSNGNTACASASGTSAAAPIVAGYIASLMAWRPSHPASEITPNTIIPILKHSARTITTSYGDLKVLDMYEAMYTMNNMTYGSASTFAGLPFNRAWVLETAGGSGTQSDPFQITTRDQLSSLATAQYYGADYEGVYFKLMNNLNIYDHMPIGYKSSGLGTNTSTYANNIEYVDVNAPFKGHFDGNKYIITAETFYPYSNSSATEYNQLPSTSEYGGVFGWIQGGSVKDLLVMIPSSGGAKDNTWGGFVGFLESGTIERCGVLTGSAFANNNYVNVGGFVGINKGTITNCFTYLSFLSGSNQSAQAPNKLSATNQRTAGFAVQNTGTITNCYAYASTLNTLFSNGTNNNVALFVSDNNSGTIQNSYWLEQGTYSGINSGSNGTNSKGCTLVELRTQSTYQNWDFNNIWYMRPLANSGLPNLRYNGAPIPRPANDQCADATLLVYGETLFGTLTDATPTTSISYSDQSDKNDVFYSFTTTDAGNYTLTLSNFLGNKDLFLYSNCNTASALASSTSSDPTETISYTCTAASTYLIRVSDYSGTGGSFDISLASPPDNTWQIGYPNPADVTATLDNGTLTISGTGAMQDWGWAGNGQTPPWYYEKDSITKIIVSNGITSIGNYACIDCINLVSVNIGTDVDSIKGAAFWNCPAVKEINSNNPTPPWIDSDNLLCCLDQTACKVYVPNGTQCAYATAPIWQNFNIVGAQHTITVTAGSGGSISPATSTVTCGSSQTFTFTPDPGYEIDQVLVDGSNVGAVNSYTFSNVTANHTVSVSFKPQATNQANLQLLSLAANGPLYQNQTGSFTATLKNNGNAAYNSRLWVYLEKLYVYSPNQSIDGGIISIAAGETKTISITGTITLPPDVYACNMIQDINNNPSNMATQQLDGTVLGVQVTVIAPSYGISIGSFDGGSVSANKTSSAAGETIMLSIAPATGYELETIAAYKTGEQTIAITLDGSGNTRSFIMPAYGVTITATFKKTQASWDAEALAAAKTAIENSSYTLAQTTANTEATVKSWLAAQINSRISSTGITVTESAITLSTFQEASNSANGNFSFSVSLTKGSASGSASQSGTILATATPVYTVTIGISANGSVSANRTSAAAGETIMLSITPATGYELETIAAYKTGEQTTSVMLSGSGNTRSFTMPAYDVSITATFKKTQATLDAEALAAAKTAIENSSYSVAQTTANTEATVKSWLAAQINSRISSTGITVTESAIALSNFQEASNGANGSFSFSVSLTKGSASGSASQSGTILATATPVYTVAIGISANGSVSASKTSAAAGETIMLSITPATGYELEAIAAYKTGEQTASVMLNGSGNTRNFTMPAYDVTVMAIFQKTQEQINKEALEASKAAIEGGTYNIAQATGNTETDVKTWLVNTLNVLFGQSHGIQFRSITSIVGDVTITAITPAVAGTETNPEGINGLFKFTVNLVKDETMLATGNVSGIIIATPYAETPVKRIQLLPLGDLTVLIINTGNVATGNLTLALSGANADVFMLSSNAENSLAVGEEAYITLTPRSGLMPGSYTAMLTVSGDGLESQSVEISHIVTGTDLSNVPQAKALKAWIQNETLHISGLAVNKPWSVYTIYGIRVYQTIAVNDEANIPLSARGVYFVLSDNRVIKVLY